MADDSIEIVEFLDFHPCNSPRGMSYYDVNILTPDQQTQLNDLKISLIRENEKYLAKHPEIRAIVALLTRHILYYRPRSNLHEYIGYFFARSKIDIEHEVNDYIEEGGFHITEGDSAVLLKSNTTSSENFEVLSSYIEDDEKPEDIATLMLDEILEKALEQLQDTGSETEINETLCDKNLAENLMSADTDKYEHDVLEYLQKIQAEYDQLGIYEFQNDELQEDDGHLNEVEINKMNNLI